MFALCEARLRSFTIASKLALYSLARALLYAKLGCARLQFASKLALYSLARALLYAKLGCARLQFASKLALYSLARALRRREL